MSDFYPKPCSEGAYYEAAKAEATGLCEDGPRCTRCFGSGTVGRKFLPKSQRWPCSKCDGRGQLPPRPKYRPCLVCEGRGRVWHRSGGIGGPSNYEATCHRCEGRGTEEAKASENLMIQIENTYPFELKISDFLEASKILFGIDTAKGKDSTGVFVIEKEKIVKKKGNEPVATFGGNIWYLSPSTDFFVFRRRGDGREFTYGKNTHNLECRDGKYFVYLKEPEIEKSEKKPAWCGQVVLWTQQHTDTHFVFSNKVREAKGQELLMRFDRKRFCLEDWTKNPHDGRAGNHYVIWEKELSEFKKGWDAAIDHLISPHDGKTSRVFFIHPALSMPAAAFIADEEKKACPR